MMKVISQLVLFASLVLASGVRGQEGQATARLDLGADFTGRHTGPVVELRMVPRSSGPWSHGFGIGVTAGIDIPGNLVCTLTPEGACVDFGPVLTSAFYEPRIHLAPRGTRVSPYLGGRVSFVQGWGGIGGGIAGVGGSTVALGNDLGASVSTVAGIVSTRAAGNLGEDWGTFHAGLRLGIGAAF